MAIDYNLLTYNGLDCAVTAEIANKILPDVDKDGYRWAYDATMGLYEPLMFMQSRGIKISRAALEETKRDILAKEGMLQEELNRLVGRELNALSPKQCAAYFYIEKGIAPYHGKDGGVTTDDKALQRIARGTSKFRGLREARLVQDIRGLRKLYGTYLDINFDADDRLRCAYNPRGTKFGRLSSSETVFGTGTNTQNLPPEFKKFLVPDDGYVFWEVDKRQAEWVVVAYLSGDANMLSVIDSGDDPHTHTSSLMFRLAKDIILQDHKVIGGLTDPDEIMERRIAAMLPENILPRTMSGRQMGKKSNHGLNYDEGFTTFSMMNEIEIAEAKRIVNLYHSIYPGIRIWYEAIKRQLAKDRTLTNCFGRKIRFLESWSDDLFKAAYSALPQSTVADGLCDGMKRTYNDSYLCSPTGGPVNLDILANVHDSILMQLPISFILSGDFYSVVSRVYDYCSPEMEYNNRKFKIATDSKIGFNWGGYHPTANPLGMQEVSADDPAIFNKRVEEILRVGSTGTTEQ